MGKNNRFSRSQTGWMKYYGIENESDFNQESISFADWLWSNLSGSFEIGEIDLAYSGNERGFWISIFLRFGNDPERFFNLVETKFFDPKSFPLLDIFDTNSPELEIGRIDFYQEVEIVEKQDEYREKFQGSQKRFLETLELGGFKVHKNDSYVLPMYDLYFDSALKTEYFQKPFIIWSRVVKKWTLMDAAGFFGTTENQIRNSEKKKIREIPRT